MAGINQLSPDIVALWQWIPMWADPLGSTENGHIVGRIVVPRNRATRPRADLDDGKRHVDSQLSRQFPLEHDGKHWEMIADLGNTQCSRSKAGIWLFFKLHSTHHFMVRLFEVAASCPDALVCTEYWNQQREVPQIRGYIQRTSPVQSKTASEKKWSMPSSCWGNSKSARLSLHGFLGLLSSRWLEPKKRPRRRLTQNVETFTQQLGNNEKNILYCYSRFGFYFSIFFLGC